MDPTARRELEILTTLAEGHPVTQRALARRLGIALGLANLYLKRLARKGHIKITTIPPHRIKYLVTPRGLTQKTRLTYEYMRYSLQLYGRARESLRAALTPLAQARGSRIALCGTGEAAELAYLTLKELGMEPTGIFDGRSGGTFLGMPVRAIQELSREDYDRVVVASFDNPAQHVEELGRRGIEAGALIILGAPVWERRGLSQAAGQRGTR
ncbi:MAG: winged helix-turn-helix transcriptional regulator [Candidatus Rokuibacteriota bacterium]